MKRIMAVSGMSLLAAVLIFGLAGCETQSVSSKVSVEPSAATIQKGQSITFTATGGFDYTWSLSTPSYGTLSTTSGDTTTYTSLFNPGGSNTVVQVLRLTSSIEGSSSSNSTPAEWTTEVFITHIE